MVEKDAHALQLSRYIHLNPVRAHMVAKPEDYSWSSYSYFIKDIRPPDYLETTFLLGYFGDKEKKSKKGMKAFVEEGMEKEIKNPLNEVERGTLLGGKGFIDWVKERFIAFRDNDREITVIKKLKKVEPNKIKDSLEKIFEKGDRLAKKIEIYFLRKYSDKTLKEIGSEYGSLGVSGVSHIVRRLEKTRAEDVHLNKKIMQVEKLIMSNGQA